MLVLTRKLDEKIQIGDNITITLIRVQGNTVRIGIDAPRDIRVIRAELAKLEGMIDSLDGSTESPLSDREEAFAHPTPMTGRSKKHQALSGRDVQETESSKLDNRISSETRISSEATSRVYMARVPSRVTSTGRAPLAAFLPTTSEVDSSIYPKSDCDQLSLGIAQ